MTSFEDEAFKQTWYNLHNFSWRDSFNSWRTFVKNKCLYFVESNMQSSVPPFSPSSSQDLSPRPPAPSFPSVRRSQTCSDGPAAPSYFFFTYAQVYVFVASKLFQVHSPDTPTTGNNIFGSLCGFLEIRKHKYGRPPVKCDPSIRCCPIEFNHFVKAFIANYYWSNINRIKHLQSKLTNYKLQIQTIFSLYTKLFWVFSDECE